MWHGKHRRHPLGNSERPGHCSGAYSGPPRPRKSDPTGTLKIRTTGKPFRKHLWKSERPENRSGSTSGNQSGWKSVPEATLKIRTTGETFRREFWKPEGMKSFFDFGYLTLAWGHEDFPPTQNNTMQRRIIKYELISQNSSAAAAQKVNEKLQAGWELYGSPFGANEASGRVVHAQALVKYEDTPQFPDDISELAYVTGDQMSELAEKVSLRITEGWRPVGNLVVGPSGEKFYQSMYRTAISSKSKD